MGAQFCKQTNCCDKKTIEINDPESNYNLNKSVVNSDESDNKQLINSGKEKKHLNVDPLSQVPVKDAVNEDLRHSALTNSNNINTNTEKIKKNNTFLQRTVTATFSKSEVKNCTKKVIKKEVIMNSIVDNIITNNNNSLAVNNPISNPSVSNVNPSSHPITVNNNYVNTININLSSPFSSNLSNQNHILKDEPQAKDTTPKKPLKAYSFDKDTSSNKNLNNNMEKEVLKDHSFLRSLIKNKDNTLINANDALHYIPKSLNSNPDQILLNYEFIVNNVNITKQLTKTKTNMRVNSNIKYVLLTRHSIKICRSKEFYISYGTAISEIQLSYITCIEITKNPFAKSIIHSLNIIFGKENNHITLSSEDGKEVEIWYKVILYLKKTIY